MQCFFEDRQRPLSGFTFRRKRIKKTAAVNFLECCNFGGILGRLQVPPLLQHAKCVVCFLLAGVDGPGDFCGSQMRDKLFPSGRTMPILIQRFYMIGRREERQWSQLQLDGN